MDGIDGRSPEDCSTTGSFSDHDIDDGSELVSDTHYRLLDAGDESFELSAAFFDALESPFVWAYLGSVDEPGLPAHVEYAAADARAVVEAEFADRPNADVRTDVVLAFYRAVAGYHCAHRT